jgi:hypothetical protein
MNKRIPGLLPSIEQECIAACFSPCLKLSLRKDDPVAVLAAASTRVAAETFSISL